MQVIIGEDQAQLGEYAARMIAAELSRQRLGVLGVATGSSPLPIYQALARHRPPGLEQVTAFALDEYVGLPHQHPQSYHAVVDATVTRPLGLDPGKVHVPNGLAADIEAECAAYETAIEAAGGIDLQILGIGSDGHVGFNEPSSSLSSRTRIKTLAPQTRSDNARFFASADEVPMHCITQGLGTILQARKLLLIAHGAGKADAVAKAVEGPLTSMCPASVLQWHRDAVVLVDAAAASGLRLRDYYNFVREHQPQWQVPPTL